MKSTTRPLKALRRGIDKIACPMADPRTRLRSHALPSTRLGADSDLVPTRTWCRACPVQNGFEHLSDRQSRPLPVHSYISVHSWGAQSSVQDPNPPARAEDAPRSVPWGQPRFLAFAQSDTADVYR